MKIGDTVRVLSPFGVSLNSEYKIINIVDNVYFLEGIEGGFDSKFMEVI